MEKVEVLEKNNINQEFNNNIISENMNNSLFSQEIDLLNKNKNQNLVNTFNNDDNINKVKYGNDEFIILGEENNSLNGETHGNIGKNIILFNRFVIGPKDHLYLLIIIIVFISFSWYLWLYAMGNFYSKILYNILHVLFFLTQFFMLFSFLVEPGIIPRNCPDYLNKKIDNNEDVNSNKIDINNKDKNKEAIPRIFTERKCRTCKIIRPPCASHCRICDNCIMDFDHHCIFVSNCIAKRNHKYFFLFLFFGSIFSILCILLNLIVIFYVFIIKANETISPICKGNNWLFLLSLFLLFISFINTTKGTPDYGLIIFPGLIGFGLLLYVWNKNIPKNNKFPSYYNPYIIIVFILGTYFAVFDIVNFVAQCYYIGRGITIKQSRSINDKMNQLILNHSEQKLKEEYFRTFTFKEQFNNIIHFLLKRVDKSLIIPERDLVY